jgi:hypothetical protein
MLTSWQGPGWQEYGMEKPQTLDPVAKKRNGLTRTERELLRCDAMQRLFPDLTPLVFRPGGETMCWGDDKTTVVYAPTGQAAAGSNRFWVGLNTSYYETIDRYERAFFAPCLRMADGTKLSFAVPMSLLNDMLYLAGRRLTTARSRNRTTSHDNIYLELKDDKWFLNLGAVLVSLDGFETAPPPSVFARTQQRRSQPPKPTMAQRVSAKLRALRAAAIELFYRFALTHGML